MGYHHRRYSNRNRNARASPRRSQPPITGGVVVAGVVALVSWCVRGLIRLIQGRRNSKPGGSRPSPVPPQHWPPANQTFSPPPAVSPVPPPPLPVPALSPAPAKPALPYRRAPHLLSQGEQAVWYPLYQAVEGKYLLFCKVRLADVALCPRDRRDERRWFKKIGSYHVDFVVCDPKTTMPLLVVELDDRRHRTARQRDFDQFKDEVLRSAGVPMYRIHAQQAYDPLELAAQIERLISEQKT